MGIDVRNLTSNELKASKQAYAFIKDGVLYKNRWNVHESEDGLVEVVNNVLYVNSDNTEYVDKIKQIYNENEYEDIKIGRAPTEALELHIIIEILQFEKSQEKDIIKRKIPFTEKKIIISEYRKFDVYSVNLKITDNTLSKLKEKIKTLNEVKIELI